MAGENALFCARNYGTRRADAITLDHGMSIIPAQDGLGDAREYRTFFVFKRTSGSFSIQLQFGSYAAYESFAKWMEEYARRKSRDNSVGVMHVVVSSRNFDKWGVPTTGITFGDDRKAVTYKMTLEFKGASGPLDVDAAELSYFYRPTTRAEDPESKYFYPAGTQLTAVDHALTSLAEFYNVADLFQDQINAAEGFGSTPEGGIESVGLLADIVTTGVTQQVAAALPGSVAPLLDWFWP